MILEMVYTPDIRHLPGRILKISSSIKTCKYARYIDLSSFTMHTMKSHHTNISGTKHPLRSGEEGEKYDNYLTKLQNICTETVGEEGKPVGESVKPNLNLPILPTPT